MDRKHLSGHCKIHGKLGSTQINSLGRYITCMYKLDDKKSIKPDRIICRFLLLWASLPGAQLSVTLRKVTMRCCILWSHILIMLPSSAVRDNSVENGIRQCCKSCLYQFRTRRDTSWIKTGGDFDAGTWPLAALALKFAANALSHEAITTLLFQLQR